MINTIAKFITLLIPIKKIRRIARKRIITAYYARNVYVKAKSIGKGFVCGGKSTATKNTIIGNHVRFSGVSLNGSGNITISDYCVLGKDVLIMTDNHNYDTGTLLPFSDDIIISKDVFIDKYVWCGSRVTILPGTKIGEGAVIQAGAVVHGEIPPCTIVGGNPAKVFKYRDMEHYNKLKNEGKFLTEEF